MKMKQMVFGILFALVTLGSNAQRVSVRLNFPTGVHVLAPGPAPYHGAVWIGPEWQWRAGRYVMVPGYWAKPRHPRAVWIPGHWKYSRRGYIWVPGRWR